MQFIQFGIICVIIYIFSSYTVTFFFLLIDGEKCLIYWTFKPQGEWDVNEVAEKLKHISALLDFKIIFVYAGSLVVKTSTNMRLLTNADEFYKAIGTFFEQFVVQCELDTSMKESFDVSIEIFYLPMKGISFNLVLSKHILKRVMSTIMFFFW